jgi:hypothetical protein
MNSRGVVAMLLIIALPVGAFSATSARTAKVTRSHRVVSPFLVRGPQAIPSGMVTRNYGLFTARWGWTQVLSAMTLIRYSMPTTPTP